jgi:hypothetical protein
MRLRRRPLLSVASLLLAQLAGLVHLLAVQHTRCPEHGEVVELAQGRSGGEAVTLASEGTELAGEQIVAESDEHCLYLASLRVSAAPGRQLQPVTAPAADHAPEPVSDVLVPAGPPAYRLAPKNSPPA